ncbi:MAG TPA: PAS domain-containing protein, partial [Candidatus Acidoferrum sp.]|nr:PAS domain-containing protein [Candidatus Acidoferrum sp.]
MALLCAMLAFFPSLTATAADSEGVSPVLWGGIAGGIALALLTGAALLLNMRLRARRERDLFASSLDTLPVARQIVAPDGSVIFASTTYRRMFPDKDMPVKALLEAQMAGEPTEVDRLAQLEAQAAAGIAGHTEITIRTPNGNIEWRDVSASPLQLLPGYVVWGVEDITPRRQVESIIRREQERFADLVEHAPIGFYSVDEEGRFLFVNATLAAWLELSRSDVA